jgi:hypothetical protein
MLEILALVFLTRKNGSIAEKKGHNPTGYKWLTVLLWFGGEIGGAILGAVVASADAGLGGLVYLFALVGAVVGAGLSRLIVNRLPGPVPVPVEVFD